MTRIALAFILLHYISPPVLFTSSVKFPGFNMRKDSLLLFTFEVTNNVYLIYRVVVLLWVLVSVFGFLVGCFLLCLETIQTYIFGKEH